MPIIGAVVVLAILASSASALRVNTPFVPCKSQVTAELFRPFSKKVWDLERWQRGAPKTSTLKAYRGKLRCAAGPGHREAIEARWGRDRLRYGRLRHHMQFCRSGEVITGRVSYFNGPASTTASGTPVSTPGLALNIVPGTEAGWLNSTTLRWMDMARAGHPQLGRTTIEGHTTVLPIIDLGPHQITYRAIDVTEAGVYQLGLSPTAFPTDVIGSVKLLPPGCI